MIWGYNFYTICAKDDRIAMSNLAALCAAVFPIAAKKNDERGTYVPLPPAVRGLIIF